MHTPHLDGLVNVEEIAFPTRGGRGLAVRTFVRATRRWAIYWVSSATGALDPPVIGGFVGDRGVFYGEDVDGDRPVRVRFVWTRLGPGAARWEQAFAYDADGGWETNWIMQFRRPPARADG